MSGLPGYDEWKLASPDDDRYEPDDDYCPNCGGEGYIYLCQDEIACIDPEVGCDLCMRRCDWCRQRRKADPDPDYLRDCRDDR